MPLISVLYRLVSLRHVRVAAGVFLLLETLCLFEKVHFCPYLSICIVFPISENIKYTRIAIPYRKMSEFRPEHTSRPDWWPKRCLIFVDIWCIFGMSCTVPTYGTVYVATHRAASDNWCWVVLRLVRYSPPIMKAFTFSLSGRMTLRRAFGGGKVPPTMTWKGGNLQPTPW